MHIWIDADAIPNPIKEILFRAATRRKIAITFVANQSLNLPVSPFINMLRVEKGYDIADNKIVMLLKADDLVITSDIPLAADAISKGAHVLSPRGEKYTIDTIKERLTIRDFMDTMRASGVQSKGPNPLSKKDREKFANQLDALLQSNHYQ